MLLAGAPPMALRDAAHVVILLLAVAAATSSTRRPRTATTPTPTLALDHTLAADALHTRIHSSVC